jgi:branched-chain amino acid transport system ATP-binding protein
MGAVGGDRLEAEGITVQFGGLTALTEVSLSIEPGLILGLIGPNGAGKTTLVNVLSGYQRPTAGTVRLGAEDITRSDPPARSRRGIVRTFQGARLFHGLSVIENVMVAALAQGTPRGAAVGRAGYIVARFDLADVANVPAGRLPYGRERMLSLARAIAARPRFILVDEPAAGLNHVEARHLGEILTHAMDDYGFGLLLIEHHMDLVMAICHEVQVLVKGSTLCRRPAAAVQTDPAVIAAYLGA